MRWRDRIAHWLHDLISTRGQRWAQIDHERRDWRRRYKEREEHFDEWPPSHNWRPRPPP